MCLGIMTAAVLVLFGCAVAAIRQEGFLAWIGQSEVRAFSSTANGANINIITPSGVNNSPDKFFPVGTIITFTIVAQGAQGNAAGYSTKDVLLSYKLASQTDAAATRFATISGTDLRDNGAAVKVTAALNTAVLNVGQQYNISACMVPSGQSPDVNTLCDKYVNVQLTSGSGFSLSGVVTDTSAPAHGVPGATITMDYDSTKTATTDSSGHYTLRNVPSGQHTLIASKNSPSDSFSPSSRMPLVTNADQSGQDFTDTTRHGFTLSGHISDLVSHAPLTGVQVTSTLGLPTVTTNLSGEYAFLNVPAGTYVITPASTSYSFTPSAKQVSVASDTTSNDFTGQPAGVHLYSDINYSGTSYTVLHNLCDMTGNTAPILQFLPTTMSLSNASSLKTNPLLTVTLYPYPNFQGTPVIANGDQADFRTINYAGSTYNYNDKVQSIRLSTDSSACPGYSVSGKVTSSEGQPVGGVLISDSDGPSTTTAADGTYVLGHLSTNSSHRLTAVSARYIFAPPSIFVSFLTANSTGNDFTATLTADQQGYVIGRVLDQNNNIIYGGVKGDITVRLTNQRTNVATVVRVDSNGWFMTRVAPGDRYLALVITEFDRFPFGSGSDYQVNAGLTRLPVFNVTVPDSSSTIIEVHDAAHPNEDVPATIRVFNHQTGATLKVDTSSDGVGGGPSFFMDPHTVYDVEVSTGPDSVDQFLTRSVVDIFGIADHSVDVTVDSPGKYVLKVEVNLVCARSKPVGGVTFCFIGRPAQDMADNRSNDPLWQSMADEVATLRASTGINQLTKTINIVSSDASQAAFPLGGTRENSYQISLNTGFVTTTAQRSDAPNVVRHESGHEFEYLVTNGWERQDVAQMVGTTRTVLGWPALFQYTSQLPYKNRLFDEVEKDGLYDADPAGGHPQESELEDFASTVFHDNQRPDRYCSSFLTKLNALPASMALGKANLESKRRVADRVFRFSRNGGTCQ